MGDGIKNKTSRKGRFNKGMDKVPGSGRQKGVPNKMTKELRNLLEDNREQLISKSIELAMSGNSVILSKLLDKLLPSLSHNRNESQALSLEEFMQGMLERTKQPQK